MRRAATRHQLARGVIALACAASALTACGGKAAAVKTPNRVRNLPGDVVPTSVLDLTGHSENDKLSSELSKTKRSYVEAIGLYSFRKGDLLQATMQVSRFTNNPRVRDVSFRETIIGQISQSGREAQAFRVAGRTVYIAPGTQQSVALWFGKRSMYLLTSRREYAQSRALLRELLKVKV